MEATYVAQRRISGANIICAEHPVFGKIYWQFISNADCNAPDHYGLTRNIDHALRIAGDWRPHFRFNSPHKFVRSSDIYPIAKRYGISRLEVRQWLGKAQWEATPAPDKLIWLAGMDGFWGGTPDWTERISDAKEFSAKDVADSADDGDDIDLMVARAQGTFVRKEDAVAAYSALQRALPQELELPPEFEEHPFAVTITAIEEDSQDFGGFIIHFAVSGEVPTEDAMEELFDHIRGSDVEDDDDPNEFSCSFNPATRSGSWCAWSKTNLQREVGASYSWKTAARQEHRHTTDPVAADHNPRIEG